MTFYINVHLNHSLSRREWLLGGERQDAVALLWSLSSFVFLPLAKASNTGLLAGVGLAGQSPLASWEERDLRCSGAEVAGVLKVAHLLLPHFTPALHPPSSHGAGFWVPACLLSHVALQTPTPLCSLLERQVHSLYM